MLVGRCGLVDMSVLEKCNGESSFVVKNRFFNGMKKTNSVA
jgi:hypothetical protein